tara:strand:+ start:1980 stop:2711 length:732 start_codon:yes stop_codon:yes gene_type:complete
MKNLNNNILITGAQGQVGKDLIKLLKKKNFNLILLDKKKIKDSYFYKIDLSNVKNLETTLKKINKKFTKIDAIVNLAAVQVFTDFEKRTFKEIESMLSVNLTANILISKFIFNKYFKKQKSGKIINISSIFGFSVPNFENYKKNDRKSSETYGASKAAIIQLTKYFASYMSKYNINVNCISPGGIENRTLQTKSFIKRYAKKVPMNRMAKVREVTNLILYLLSPESNYINGQNIVIDGGYTIK